jgi:hypothetical protein
LEDGEIDEEVAKYVSDEHVTTHKNSEEIATSVRGSGKPLSFDLDGQSETATVPPLTPNQ